MPALRQHGRAEPNRLDQEDERAGDCGDGPPPPRGGPEAAVGEPERESVADRLAEREPPAMPRRRADGRHPPALSGQGGHDLRFAELGAVADRLGLASSHGEVIPRQPPWPSSRRAEERRVFAEDDRPVDGRAPRLVLDHAGRGRHVVVFKGFEPRRDPARPRPARVFGEGHDLARRPLQAEPPEPRHGRPGLSGDDHLDPVVERFDATRDGLRRPARRDHDAQPHVGGRRSHRPAMGHTGSPGRMAIGRVRRADRSAFVPMGSVRTADPTKGGGSARFGITRPVPGSNPPRRGNRPARPPRPRSGRGR